MNTAKAVIHSGVHLLDCLHLSLSSITELHRQPCNDHHFFPSWLSFPIYLFLCYLSCYSHLARDSPLISFNMSLPLRIASGKYPSFISSGSPISVRISRCSYIGKPQWNSILITTLLTRVPLCAETIILSLYRHSIAFRHTHPQAIQPPWATKTHHTYSTIPLTLPL